MSKNTVYLVMLLTVAWLILVESISIVQIAIGFAASIICVICFYRFFDLGKFANINLWRLLLYLFYLIGQIYVAGIKAIILVIKGAAVDIVKVRTIAENDLFIVLLANSITLTPGTISLEITGNEISVLWLREVDADPLELEDADEIIKGKLEKQLLKAQK